MGGVMRRPRIGFITNAEYPDLHADDRIAAGHILPFADVVPIVWTQSALEGVDAAVLRSAWDSHLQPARFIEWLRAAAPEMRLFNSLALVAWNMNKRYLLELAQAGAPVIPTRVYGKGSRPDLIRDMDGCGWSEIVVKPAISASAYRTGRFSREADGFTAAGPLLNEILSEGDALVQPLQSEVFTTGERSAVYIDGAFTHVVRRLPFGTITPKRKPGANAVPFSEAEQRFADSILARLPERPLYARVDYIVRESGEALLMELELIDPSLFFQHHPAAAIAFAQALRRRF